VEYNSYHAYINDCILYRGEEYDVKTEFPKCNEKRYRKKGKIISKKVVHIMPIIPRLMRIF